MDRSVLSLLPPQPIPILCQGSGPKPAWPQLWAMDWHGPVLVDLLPEALRQCRLRSKVLVILRTAYLAVQATT
jgi:hypothetical protein